MGKQSLFFDIPDIPEEEEFDWRKEWIDMPEYDNKVIRPYKSITVHFRNEEDYEEFSVFLKQNLTEKTKSVWYPKAEKGENKNLRYTDRLKTFFDES